jgi:glucokinase
VVFHKVDNKRFWIGFDLGGTKMLSIAFDERMKMVARRRKKSAGVEGVNASLDRITQTIERTLEEALATPDQLLGIGIGCPGPVEWEKGIVRVAVNLGWKNVPVGSILSKRFGCPVAVLNDVDAGTYGEFSSGAAEGSRCTIGLFPGTGIGGGCVYEGKILRGKTLTCMEVGHTRISSSHRTSGTNLAGTIETEASRLAIAAECAKLAFRGEAPNLLRIAGTDLSNIRSKAIAQAIEAGDSAVQRVVEEAAQQIGFSVVNLIHLLLPDTIVLGGGLVDAMPKLFVREVEKTVENSILDCYKGETKVVVAKLGDDAGAIGAAAWAAAQFKHAREAETENLPDVAVITDNS